MKLKTSKTQIQTNKMYSLKPRQLSRFLTMLKVLQRNTHKRFISLDYFKFQIS